MKGTHDPLLDHPPFPQSQNNHTKKQGAAKEFGKILPDEDEESCSIVHVYGHLVWTRIIQDLPPDSDGIPSWKQPDSVYLFRSGKGFARGCVRWPARRASHGGLVRCQRYRVI